MHAFRTPGTAAAVLIAGAALLVPVAMAQGSGITPSVQAPAAVVAPADSSRPAQEVQARCQPLAGDFRAACEARISGSSGAAGTPPRVEIVVRPPGTDAAPAQSRTPGQDSAVPAPAK